MAPIGDLVGAVDGQTAPRRGPPPPLGGLGDGVDDDRDPLGALHVALGAPTRTVTRLITPEHAPRGPHHADVGPDRGCATPCGTHSGHPPRVYTADHPPGRRRGGPTRATWCASACTSGSMRRQGHSRGSNTNSSEPPGRDSKRPTAGWSIAGVPPRQRPSVRGPSSNVTVTSV